MADIVKTLVQESSDIPEGMPRPVRFSTVINVWTEVQIPDDATRILYQAATADSVLAFGDLSAGDALTATIDDTGTTGDHYMTVDAGSGVAIELPPIFTLDKCGNRVYRQDLRIFVTSATDDAEHAVVATYGAVDVSE